MHVWSDIVARELAMLVTLFALGIGPASFLSRRFDAAARLAMAPVLGLCLGTAVFTTLIWFTAARNSYWLLLVLAAVSLAVALARSLKAVASEGERVRAGAARSPRVVLLLRRLRASDAVMLGAVCVIVAAPFSYTLHERHSVQVGGFGVADSAGYSGEIDGAQQESLQEAKRVPPPSANLTKILWAGYSRGTQNLDAVPLSANVNELLGLHATDTQTLYVIVFLLAGALGAFAAIRYAVPKPRWPAAFAGVLFAGPFFMQLIADGSQAALCGLSLILPIAAIGSDALRRTRVASLVLFALLISGLMALYPLFVPGVALACAAVLLVVGTTAWWRGRLHRRTLLLALGALGLVVALAIVFNLVSFLRDVSYWRGVLNGDYYIEGLPVYHLPYSVLPGWLLQTREFYFLPELGSTTPKQILLGVLLPLLFVAVIVAGFKRKRAALVLLPLVLVFLAMAEYTNAAHHCSYCTDRTLLPIAPLGIALLAIGLAALAMAPRAWMRFGAVAVAVVALLAVGSRARQERLRFADGNYFLEAGTRSLAGQLPPHPGRVALEGYGADPLHAVSEQPLTYYLLSERNHDAVSVPNEITDYNSFAYISGPNSANPQFTPNYRYVLTRFGGIKTPRRVLRRTGSIALQERTTPVDVIVLSGVAVPPARLDAQAVPWVEGPVHLIVAGGGSEPVWVMLRFATIVPVTVPRQAGVRVDTSHHDTLTACVRATGTAPVRHAAISLSFASLPGIVPPEPFALPEPTQGVQLVEVSAAARCSTNA